MVAAHGLASLLVILGVNERLDATDVIRHDFEQRLGTTLSTTPTLAVHLDPGMQDDIQAVRDRVGSLGWACNSLINIVNSLASPIATLVIAAYTDLRLLILVPLAALAPMLARRPMRWEERAEGQSPAPGQLSAHLTDLTLGATSACELRVLGARGWALDRLVGAVAAWRVPFVRGGWRTAALETGFSVLYLGTTAAMLVWIIRDARHGQVSPAAVATAVLVVGDLRDGVESATWALQSLSRVVRTVRRIRGLRPLLLMSTPPTPAPVPRPSGCATASDSTGSLHLPRSLRGDLAASTCICRPAPRSLWSGRTAQASPPSSGCSPARTTGAPVASPSTAPTCATSTRPRGADSVPALSGSRLPRADRP